MLCPTPVGNLADITLRALAELSSADLILAEDTRRTAVLLRHHGIAAAVASLHDHNEDERSGGVIERLRRGQRIAVCSDAGTPLLADPGFRLVRAVLDAGLGVTALPGPSALLPALTLSGLPIHRFAFLGFLPRPPAALRTALAEGLALPMTVAWYESPLRLGRALEQLADLGAGARRAAVARELSKLHEEVARGTVAELAERYGGNPPRGEVVLLVGPPDPVSAADAWQGAMADIRAARAAGESPSRAVASAAGRWGVDRRALYAEACGRGDPPARLDGEP